MKSTRRSFLKGVGAGVLCLTLGQLGFDLGEAQAYAGKLKIEGAKEVISVCPFCSVCCQVIAYVRDGKLVSTEGDPDFPVNEGALCAKGAALFSMPWLSGGLQGMARPARQRDQTARHAPEPAGS
jgi:Anaerobic dehydrogenases, typically selenocysteine-containing